MISTFTFTLLLLYRQSGLISLLARDTISPQRSLDLTPKIQVALPIDLSHFDIVVVGAGLSGAVLAERHAEVLGQKVLVIDKREHIGGNCFDYVDAETGIRVNKYGAHLFHTNDETVWAYVNRFARWVRWDHRVLGLINGTLVPIPVNINTVNALFGLSIQTTAQMDAWLQAEQVHYAERPPNNSEEMALSRVGSRLYQLIFRDYTQKQWNRSATALGPEVTARIPVRHDFDDRYFGDKYQALPADGYTRFFQRLLSHPNIEVRTGVDYFDLNVPKSVLHTYYTGPIDRFFKSDDRLEYRSLQFERRALLNHEGYWQPASVVNYPSLDTPHTRIVEYKHMLHQKSPHSVLFTEYPADDGEPFYPVPTERNKALYRRLVKQAADIPNVTFVGRLANYKYFNMDEAISNALSIFKKQQWPPPRICAVTAIFGTYERTLKQPAEQRDYPLKLFAFTNRDDLVAGAWTVIKYTDTPIMQFCRNGFRNSPCENGNFFNLGKFYKMQMHQIPEIRSNCDVAIWFDASVQITNPDFAKIIAEKVQMGQNLLVFRHARGGSMQAEADASIASDRYHTTVAYGMSQPFQDVNMQMVAWKAEGFAEHWWRSDPTLAEVKFDPEFGMWVTCMVVFDFRRRETIPFLNLWWDQNLRHTTQDQMTFAYAVWKTRTLPLTLPFGDIAGDFGSNTLYQKRSHGE